MQGFLSSDLACHGTHASTFTHMNVQKERGEGRERYREENTQRKNKENKHRTLLHHSS